jgi:sulfonate transport system substrate-binding protein
MINAKSVLLAAAVALAAAPLGGGARGDEPVAIRAGWVLTPASLIPILFPEPGIAKHYGASYTLDITRFSGTPPMITALAAGELDIAALGFSTIGVAVENAGISDLRVIADEMRNGVGDYFTGQYSVLKDSPIRQVEDLRGKIVAANGIGSGADIIMRAVLLKHGMVERRDYTDVEVQFPNMKAMLVDRKIDLATFTAPYIYDPDVAKLARPLFSQTDAFGATEMSFWTARTGFLQQKRQAMVDLLEDYVRSIRWYLDPANHAEAVSVVAKITKMAPETIDGWLFTKKDYYRDPNGKPDLDALQKNVAAQAEQGFIKANLNVSDYADLSLVEEAARRVK